MKNCRWGSWVHFWMGLNQRATEGGGGNHGDVKWAFEHMSTDAQEESAGSCGSRGRNGEGR